MSKKKIPEGYRQCGRCNKILPKDNACTCFRKKKSKKYRFKDGETVIIYTNEKDD